MKSAGNDIVALKTIDIQRTRDARFHSKFITDTELAIFQQLEGISFENFVWLLWSVKESAYKYWQRHDAGMIFSPAKLIVQQLNIPPDFTLNPFTGIYWDSEDTSTGYIAGQISCGNTRLWFRSYLTHDFITTVVDANNQFENVHWGVQLVEYTDHQHQSQEVRSFALIKLKLILDKADLHIVKSEIGYPVVMEGGTPLDVALSFAHHDRFVGYSFTK